MPNLLDAKLRYSNFYRLKLFSKEINTVDSDINTFDSKDGIKIEFENIRKAYRTALEIAPQISDARNDYYDFIKGGLFTLADNYQNEFIEWLKLGLLMAESLKDIEKQFDLLDWLNDFLIKIGRPQEAIYFLQKVLKLSRETQNQKLEAYALNELARVHYLASPSGIQPLGGMVADAAYSIRYYRKALIVSRKINAENEIAYALHGLGDIYLNALYFRNALKYYNIALELARRSGSTKILRNCLFGISNAYFFMGNWKKSSEFYDSYVETLSINNSEKIKQKSERELLFWGSIDRWYQAEDHVLELIDSGNQVSLERVAPLRTSFGAHLFMGHYKECETILDQLEIISETFNSIMLKEYVVVNRIKLFLAEGDKSRAYTQVKIFNDIRTQIDLPHGENIIFGIYNIITLLPNRLIKDIFKIINTPLLLSRQILLIQIVGFFLDYLFFFRGIELDLCQSLEKYNQLIAKHPQVKKLYLKRGWLHEALNDFESARSDAHTVLLIDPDNIEALNLLASFYEVRREFDKAVACYDQAIKKKSNLAILWSNRGLAKFHGRLFEEAIADFSAAIKLKPSRARYYSHRAIAYFKNDKKLAAEQDFVKALSLKIDDSVYFDIALRYIDEGDLERAIEFLKKSYDENPIDFMRDFKTDPYIDEIRNTTQYMGFLFQIDD